VWQAHIALASNPALHVTVRRPAYSGQAAPHVSAPVTAPSEAITQWKGGQHRQHRVSLAIGNAGSKRPARGACIQESTPRSTVFALEWTHPTTSKTAGFSRLLRTVDASGRRAKRRATKTRTGGVYESHEKSACSGQTFPSIHRRCERSRRLNSLSGFFDGSSWSLRGLRHDRSEIAGDN
jgi:hypothetical protein